MKYGKPDALNHKIGGEWINFSAETFVERVRHVALGLAALGIKRGDRVALLSENRPEWSITDLAILSLGAINVPIYTTQAIDQIRYILTDSGARAIFISNRRLYKHARQALERLGFLENLIFFDAEGSEGVERAMSLDALEENGREQARRTPAAFDEYLSAVRPQDLATIIYTSGTTGEPKGVMLTHNNFISNVLAITDGLPISSTDVALSVLPLSHIFERTGFYVFCYNGMSVYYAASFDQVGENLREVRPTVMTAVPRLFEKVYHRIVKKGMSEKGWKRKVFLRAMTVGQRYAELKDKAPASAQDPGPAAEDCQSFGVLQMARGCWRPPAILCLRRCAAVSRAFLFISRCGDSGPSGLRRHRNLHRVGKSSRQ